MCKYETSYAFGKRRMQYDIGDAPLETPKEEPQKSLDPDQDKKLSGDMRELYDRLLPTEDSEKRRKSLVEKLERILYKEFPGNDFKVHVFGSSGNLLCTSESDGLLVCDQYLSNFPSGHLHSNPNEKARHDAYAGSRFG
jgi:DNA polymerase sigma